MIHGTGGHPTAGDGAPHGHGVGVARHGARDGAGHIIRTIHHGEGTTDPHIPLREHTRLTPARHRQAAHTEALRPADTLRADRITPATVTVLRPAQPTTGEVRQHHGPATALRLARHRPAALFSRGATDSADTHRPTATGTSRTATARRTPTTPAIATVPPTTAPTVRAARAASEALAAEVTPAEAPAVAAAAEVHAADKILQACVPDSGTPPHASTIKD